MQRLQAFRLRFKFEHVESVRTWALGIFIIYAFDCRVHLGFLCFTINTFTLQRAVGEWRKDGQTDHSGGASVLLQVPGDGVCWQLDATDVGNASRERQINCLHNTSRY